VSLFEAQVARRESVVMLSSDIPKTRVSLERVDHAAPVHYDMRIVDAHLSSTNVQVAS